MSGTRRAPWQNNERHYCEACNVWLGSDRQSVLLHQNGKKHKEKVEESMQQKRKEKLQQESQAKLIAQSLQQMNSVASQAAAQDSGFFVGSAASATTTPSYVSSTTRVPPPPPPPPPPKQQQQEQQQQQRVKQERNEKNEWESRKRKRKEEQLRKRGGGESTDDEGQSEQPSVAKRIKLTIEAGHGHYTNDNHRVFLEGPTFGDILEEDMPIQIWTGSLTTGLAEKRLLDRDMHWKNGLVAAVRQRPSCGTDLLTRLVTDVAYLKSDDDTEETLERSVSLDRIRIILGADESIPDTIKEARLLAQGGEEIDTTAAQETVDETTGLTSWSTVKIKRTTVRQELKEERARSRQKRKEAAQEADKQQREADARKMEEAKVSNADDSALGAYDVWSRTKDGYKGVDIHGEAAVDIHEMGKKLSDGKGAIGFKKSAFKAKKKKQNRRTTSADDDDD